jgi:hypothetical protein
MAIPVFVDQVMACAGLPNSESPQNDCANERENRHHHQDVELNGETHV